MSVKKWFCKKEKNRKISVPSDVVVTVIVADPYEIMIPFYTSVKTSEKTQIICDVLREYRKWVLVYSHQLVLGDLRWINEKGFKKGVHGTKTF